jgi:subtilase family serine protease
MAPGQVRSVTALLPTNNLGGRYIVRAVVNPDRLAPELDLLNDDVDAPVNVRQENDLSITTTGITFSPAAQGQVRVDVTVRNLGPPLALDVPVDVYKGSPTTGAKLGTGMVPAGLGLNTTATVSVLWPAQSANGPTAIYAVVDPQNLLPEADEANNTASVSTTRARSRPWTWRYSGRRR